MEALGYVVSNKFILIAVNTKLTIKWGTGPADTFSLPNARKVHTIGKHLAISVIGIPHKISDIYKYILKINNQQSTYDSIVEDLESIFNTDREKLVAKVGQVRDLVSRHTDASGVLDEAAVGAALAGNPELATIMTEAKSLIGAGANGVTKIFLFGRENDQNVYGEYIVLGFNMTGYKETAPQADYVFYNIVSSIADPTLMEELISRQRDELLPLLTPGWETDSELENIVFAKCRQLLSDALTELSNSTESPNVEFYTLNNETNFEFAEPAIHLTNIEFNRQ
ncbi:MAG: hypothetical protein V4592_13930 [Bacteroidota bacterium]